MSYDEPDGAEPDRRWQWVVIAVLIALLLLLLGYCTIRSVDDNTSISGVTPTSSSPVIPPTTVVAGTTGATEPGPIVIDPTDTATGTSTRTRLPVVPVTTRPATTPPVTTRPVTTGAVPPATSTPRRTPADAPQTDGGGTAPGNGVPRVLGGLALIVAAVLSGAFAATRWRQARR